MSKDFNETLRSHILIASIKCEEESSLVIKLLLRHIKKESKTLGNKSSSLSFKNKIDILYDLSDLNADEYNCLIKFMEIRNQFIHNPNCSNFTQLGKENKELTNFLKTKFNLLEFTEKKYLNCFNELFKMCYEKLNELKLDYMHGMSKEIYRYVNDKLVEEIPNLIDEAKKRFFDFQEKLRETNPYSILKHDDLKEKIEFFSTEISYGITKKNMEIALELEGDEMIFSRKSRKN